jgi:AcrR family transcriptional regulator
MKGTTRRLCDGVSETTFCALTDQMQGGRAQRRPEEKRARLLTAARTAFAKSGYGASVHEICQTAGVGIGTFYHQFPDKSDLMRRLMEEEHQYRVREFDALAAYPADDFAAKVAGILAGSEPGLLVAMVEAIGIDERLRDFARDLRNSTRERLAVALARAREARHVREPSLDASTAAWAALLLADVSIEDPGSPNVPKAIEVLAFGSGGTARTGA